LLILSLHSISARAFICHESWPNIVSSLDSRASFGKEKRRNFCRVSGSFCPHCVCVYSKTLLKKQPKPSPHPTLDCDGKEEVLVNLHIVPCSNHWSLVCPRIHWKGGASGVLVISRRPVTVYFPDRLAYYCGWWSIFLAHPCNMR